MSLRSHPMYWYWEMSLHIDLSRQMYPRFYLHTFVCKSKQAIFHHEIQMLLFLWSTSLSNIMLKMSTLKWKLEIACDQVRLNYIDVPWKLLQHGPLSGTFLSFFFWQILKPQVNNRENNVFSIIFHNANLSCFKTYL